ncbi:LADA_0E02564g1_1 [Lachancea dasiensis]|uniref:LADA_0E02564g1_1 n=1 Tax=Lachancea dasiensis TaxID=1072105 RepID=A0A1G4JAU7_9SACH|nr:LADA_0E02564g1_1 [Lachancea dasiensis]
MRAGLFFSALMAVATASPVALNDFVKRDSEDFDPIEAWPGNWTLSNWSNWTNSSNVTQWESPKLQVFITGGHYKLSNWTSSPDVTITSLFNQTSLNATELYSVASSVSKSLASDAYTGVVVLGHEKALESLGFFLSVVVDSPKSLVVTSKLDDGLTVAWSDDSWWRGTLIVDQTLIYSGAVYTPSTPGAVSIGAVYDKTPWFWFTPAWPMLLSPESTIRTEYWNFTDVIQANSTISTNGTTIPIVYDAYYNPGLLEYLSGSIDGLVVVSSGNSTGSEFTSASIPIVFASDDYYPVFVDDVPAGAIAAGGLSPVQSQLLLAIALTNNVTASSQLQDIFFS